MRTDELLGRARAAAELAAPCRLCPRACRVDRAGGQRGRCGQSAGPVVYTRRVHRGEEPPIAGRRGSGTIFFSGCGLGCVYCQNHPFSQQGEGRPASVAELASMMVELADSGCHNLNLVTATQFLPGVLEALARTRALGIELPVVWNTSSYETPEVLALLDGVVDVYLADARYGRAETGARLSGAPDYAAVSRAALRAMLRQVGPLVPAGDEPVSRGLIVRHLVLPDLAQETAEVLAWIARELGRDVPVSLMGQYIPSHRAADYPPLDRPPSAAEYAAAEAVLMELGLTAGWTQPPEEEFDRAEFWGRGF